ncbi:MAG: HAMP domain-containing sensor histidine kinase [Bacteroidota bacterium]
MKKHALLFLFTIGLSLISWHSHARQLPIYEAQAIGYCEQQLALAQQRGLIFSIEEAYHCLAEAYANSGDYKKAYAYERLRFAKHDSISRTRNTLPAAFLTTADVSRAKRIQTSNHSRSFISTIRENEPFISPTLLVIYSLAILLLSFLLYRNYCRTQQINRLFYQQTEMLVAQRDSIEEKSWKMEQLNITKDKFFSIVAHDLRGPINSLASFSHLLANDLQRLNPQEIKVIAQELNKSVKNTSKLMENLLTWARLQMNNLHQYPSNIDLHKIVEENMALFHMTAQQKQIGLLIDTHPGLKVYADESQLRFILRNLIANALKFTHPQGTVRIVTQVEKDQIKISVEDNGVGISPELAEKLFHIDAKHSTIGTAGEKGTGLGLVLCKEFAEKNGGQIQLHSAPGKGSTFSIYLQQAIG